MNVPALPPIPIEEVATYPRPGTAIPTSIAFEPGGGKVTFLYSPERNLTQGLYAFDPDAPELRMVFEPPERGDTEETLSHAEKLRRERLRIRSVGVTRYHWARDTARILVPLQGDLWIQDGLDGKAQKLLDAGPSPILDPQLSPDGSHVAFVLDGALHVMKAEPSAAPRRLSPPAEDGLTYGQAEYIAQEEMDRHRGFWWSRDGKWLAFTEVDERALPRFRIEHLGADPPESEEHRYPFTGNDNAAVRLGIVSTRGGEVRWLDLGATEIASPERPHDFYLARVHWLARGDLLVELENREQNRLDLVRYRVPSGEAQLLAQERSDVWINLHGIFQPLDELEDETLRDGFVWATERSGFRHLVLFDGEGQEVRALTDGPWMVEAVVGLDPAGRQLYFTGTQASPVERHLYRVGLDGGEPARVTEGEGMHDVVMNDDATRFVDVHSTLAAPPTVTVRRAQDGDVVARLKIAADPRVAVLDLQPPELVQIENRAGVTLHGAIYRPAGEGPFPTIVAVYGGPHVQRVTREWSLTADLAAQHLRRLGYLVFKLDNRGSSRRGLAFEGAIRHDLGNVELQDQIDGVNWLVQQGLTNPERVGIYGWSYGGYMAAMALAKAPEVFRVAVAGAPVTDWGGYDTHYSERYMGTPESNPEGYARSSVLQHVDHIEGKLMLVHGALDENVHFRHTARLINALIRANKEYTLLLFPDERHMPRSLADRIYMEERVRDFFVENL